MHLAKAARNILVALIAGLLAVPGGPSSAAVPAWSELPQDMAVTGPGARSWALSLADPFVADLQGTGYDLGEAAHDLRTRASFVATLRDAWGVHGRDDLLKTLDELRARGMHAAYDDTLARLREAPDERNWLQRIHAKLLHPQAEHRLEVVASQAPQLGAAGVLAYDISRSVNLARWGYQAGYLSGSETWTLVMASDRLAQSRFDSWDAYGSSFLAGRDFWGGASAASRASFEQEVHGLLTRPDGAWRVQPWREDLSATPVRAADPIVGDLAGALAQDAPGDAAGQDILSESGVEHWVAQVPPGPAAQAAALLIDGHVDELEGLMRSAATGDGRDPAGVWRRSQIYAGIAAVFPDQVDHPLWPVLDHTIAGWTARHAASDMAALVLAQYWISHAWALRGEGYPATPSIRQEQAFVGDLQRAEKVLDDHERSHDLAATEEPHWAVMRVRLANLLGRDKPAIHRMGIEALRGHPDYDPIAAETALALNPVWGGSQADARSFLDEAMALGRPQSGEQLRARVALHLARNAGLRQALLLANAGFTWEGVKPAVDELVARYPDPYNINVARMLGCISDIPARAQPYLQRLEGRIQPTAWFDDPWYVGQCARSAGVALHDHAPWIEDAPPPRKPTSARDTGSPLPPMAAAIVGLLLALWVFLRRRGSWGEARGLAPVSTPEPPLPAATPQSGLNILDSRMGIQSAGPAPVVGLRFYTVIGSIGMIFFGGASIGAFLALQYPPIAIFVLFFLMSAGMLMAAGTYSFEEGAVVYSSRFGRFRMEWADVRRVEFSPMGTLVLHGTDSRFVVFPAAYWSGSHKQQAADALARAISGTGLAPTPSRIADYRLFKNTRLRP